jgi:hypothetical protein
LFQAQKFAHAEQLMEQDEIYEIDRSKSRVLIVSNRKTSGLKPLQSVDDHASFDLLRRTKIVLHPEA